MSRKTYPSDVSADEWAFVASYLTLMTLQAPQRHHALRDLFVALRWLVRCGAPSALLWTVCSPLWSLRETPSAEIATTPC
jgi:hypothetical protein